MTDSQLVWKNVRLYRAWPNGTKHQYLGTLVANAGGQWAVWAKGLRLGAWPDEEAARRALEEHCSEKELKR